jgi:hypothetical protein
MQLLQEAGFEVRHCALVPRPTLLPGALIEWLRTFFMGSFLAHLPSDGSPGTFQSERPRHAFELSLSPVDAERKKIQIAEEIMAEVQADCEVDQRDQFTGRWSIMYVRLRFEAVARIGGV